MIRRLLDQLPPHVHGFWIPREDRFKGEYIPANEERLAHVTGFKGSAGIAIMTHSASALFIDGRYTLQAAQESPLPTLSFTQAAIKTFIKSLPGPVGFDPWLMTEASYQQWKEYLTALESNPVDAIWERSRQQTWSIVDHPIQWAGATTEEKLTCHSWKDDEAFLICDPATLSWLCNIRANIVPYTPVVLGWGLVWKNEVHLWSDGTDTTGRLNCHPENKCLDFLQNLPSNITIYYDGAQTPHAFIRALKNTAPTINPYLIPKACKNKTEQQGMRNAHKRDSQAVKGFLTDLKQELKKRSITEKEAAEMLLEHRKKQPHFRTPSFETIAASGANAAIVHYHPKGEVSLHGLFLVDSGGQYDDGTTDITRVIAVNEPTHEQIQRYTQVLKGHIALARAIFPHGTTGHQLDVLARQYLWQEGCDYKHGTGHGVGSCLSVHESPPTISTRHSSVPLEVGMVVSNEPGFYKTNEYGIRLENLMMVVPSLFKDFLCFETLTYVPFEKSLIDFTKLTQEERDWLQVYQQKSSL